MEDPQLVLVGVATSLRHWTGGVLDVVTLLRHSVVDVATSSQQ